MADDKIKISSRFKALIPEINDKLTQGYKYDAVIEWLKDEYNLSISPSAFSVYVSRFIIKPRKNLGNIPNLGRVHSPVSNTVIDTNFENNSFKEVEENVLDTNKDLASYVSDKNLNLNTSSNNTHSNDSELDSVDHEALVHAVEKLKHDTLGGRYMFDEFFKLNTK